MSGEINKLYCTVCKKDFTNEGFAYCPHCGKILIDITIKSNYIETLARCSKWRVRELDNKPVRKDGYNVEEHVVAELGNFNGTMEEVLNHFLGYKTKIHLIPLDERKCVPVPVSLEAVVFTWGEESVNSELLVLDLDKASTNSSIGYKPRFNFENNTVIRANRVNIK